jgi:ectoine hydroxylase-related dioxygenase (phytanoyl-CoA dioxygenase family)
MITNSDEQHFHDNGWVVPKWRLPEDRLADLRTLVEGALASHADKRNYLPDLQRYAPDVLSVASAADVLNMVQAFTGPDIAIWGTGVFGKPAHDGVATPWHQDGQYWPMRPLATTSAWLALDDATLKNGCMRVISGSHRPRKLYDHRTVDASKLTLNQELDWQALGFEREQPIEIEAGQMILFDLYLIHGSHSNDTPQQRRALTIRYMPTTSHFDRELAARQHREMAVPDLSKRHLYRVRGIDHCGKNKLVELPG